MFRNPPKAQTCKQPCSCPWELFSTRMWMSGFMPSPAWKKHCIGTRYREHPSVDLKRNQISIWTKSLKLLIVTGCWIELGYSPQFIKLGWFIFPNSEEWCIYKVHFSNLLCGLIVCLGHVWLLHQEPHT